MTELLIVRHGQSEWNEIGRWQGQSDPPLTELGRREAAAAGARLAAGAMGEFDSIWASDLWRAVTTATLIAQALGDEIVSTHRCIRERFAGPWEGLTREEIEAGWPGYLEQRMRPEGFESDDSLTQRAMAGLEDIAERTDRAVVVAHGGVIRCIDRHLGLQGRSIANLSSRLLTRDSSGWSIADGPDLAAGTDTGLE